MNWVPLPAPGDVLVLAAASLGFKQPVMVTVSLDAVPRDGCEVEGVDGACAESASPATVNAPTVPNRSLVMVEFLFRKAARVPPCPVLRECRTRAIVSATMRLRGWHTTCCSGR